MRVVYRQSSTEDSPDWSHSARRAAHRK